MSDPTPETPAFARAWRLLLPVSLVVMGVAAAFGVFDTTARSAWVFVAGAAIGIVGLASLILRLVISARRGVAAIEARIEDEIEGRGEGR